MRIKKRVSRVEAQQVLFVSECPGLQAQKSVTPALKETVPYFSQDLAQFLDAIESLLEPGPANEGTSRSQRCTG